MSFWRRSLTKQREQPPLSGPQEGSLLGPDNPCPFPHIYHQVLGQAGLIP